MKNIFNYNCIFAKKNYTHSCVIVATLFSKEEGKGHNAEKPMIIGGGDREEEREGKKRGCWRSGPLLLSPPSKSKTKECKKIFQSLFCHQFGG